MPEVCSTRHPVLGKEKIKMKKEDVKLFGQFLSSVVLYPNYIPNMLRKYEQTVNLRVASFLFLFALRMPKLYFS